MEIKLLLESHYGGSQVFELVWNPWAEAVDMFTTSMVWACWTRWMLTLFYPHGWWPCVSLNPDFKDSKNCCTAMAMMKVSKERIGAVSTRVTASMIWKGRKDRLRNFLFLGSICECLFNVSHFEIWPLSCGVNLRFLAGTHIGLGSPMVNTHLNPLPVVGVDRAPSTGQWWGLSISLVFQVLFLG